MANLWEDMTPEEQNVIVNAHLAGSKKDNANLNRAREQLANNPSLVARLAQEEGLEGGEAANHELDDTDPDAEETMEEEASDIERNVAASLADDVNIQETGEVSPQGDIPPPEDGEDMTTYVNRLMGLMQESEDGMEVAGQYEDDRRESLDLARKTRGMDDRTAQENMVKIRRHKASGGYNG